jgi:hypothetical protein
MYRLTDALAARSRSPRSLGQASAKTAATLAFPSTTAAARAADLVRR